MRAPAIAIASYVLTRNGASSQEILEHFQVERTTLRRRRAELRRLGVAFVENGAGSFYVPEGLSAAASEHMRGTRPPDPDTGGHSARAGAREAWVGDA